MDINGIGQNTTLASNNIKYKKPEVSFQDFLSKNTEEAAKTDSTKTFPIPQSKSINYNNRKLDYLELNNIPFKTFVTESMQFSASDIKTQIDELCDDVTGENIDMDMLNECLDLYIAEKRKG